MWKKIHGRKSKVILETIGGNKETPIFIIKNDFRSIIIIMVKNSGWALNRSTAKHIEVHYGL
jgi:hypothetical protein